MSGLVTNLHSVHTGLMTNTTVPLTSTEVAQRVGESIKALLVSRGHDVTWLANEIGIGVPAVLNAFHGPMPLWFVQDAALYLEVSPAALIEGRP